LFPLVLLLAGCGDDEATDTTPTVTLPVEGITASAYFVRNEEVWPVERGGGDVLEIVRESTLDALLRGPSDTEAEELDMSTAIPEGVDAELTVRDGVAEVELTGADELSRLALAQIVYTLTQFPDIQSVSIDGQTYTRTDFEEQTPSVLVESPLPFAEVSTPITATGTANTFEANFLYELLDSDGNVVDENFVTATSGTGTRGTFEFTTADVDDVATLVVFEESAEDGSRINEVEIPLTAES
jgi:hypothetical protein